MVSFFQKLVNILAGTPEQDEVKKIIQEFESGSFTARNEFLPKINKLFRNYDTLSFYPDDILAFKSPEELYDTLRRKAQLFKQVQALEDEWQSLIS
ncbi:MAG: hypothetical protein Q7T51_02260 [Candidatus Moranbacteria bacterium]|nr:hypothetical protein [Candidatus Moranbacteria bacterium]